MSFSAKNQLTQTVITLMPVTTAAIINALIPLAVGILFASYPEQLLPAKDRADEKKRKRLKQAGAGLILISLGYFILAFLNG